MANSSWKISLAGDKELQRAMKEIEPKVGRKVIRGSVRKASKLIMREAKALAPIMQADQRVGPSTQMPNPGTLRKGIRVAAGIRRKHHYRVNVGFKERSKMGIPEGAEHYAPMAVEVGRESDRKFFNFGPAKGAHFMITAYVNKRKGSDAIIIGETKDGLIKFWRTNTRRPR